MLLISSVQVLLLGTLYTLSRKYQNIQQSNGIDNDLKYFYHPIYQVFWLFFGMAICLPFKNLLESKDKDDNSKKEMTPYVLIFPALFDVIATVCDATGLIFVSICLILSLFIFNCKSWFITFFTFTFITYTFYNYL